MCSTNVNDAKELIRQAEIDLAKIRKEYESSLETKAVKGSLLVQIKNFMENLRSALDFIAHDLFKRYGSSKGAKSKIYFPYATVSQNQADFEKSGRIEKCIPGLSASRPDIVQLLLDVQHFGSCGNTWLPLFMELTNENKHQRLTPQVRKESRELRISGGGASMGVGEGTSISIGPGASVSIGRAIIHGGQSFDVDNPPRVQGGRVEVIKWISFHFEENNQPVIPLLDSALKGVKEMVTSLSRK